MLYDGLPRSYLIRQCKDEINKLSHIVRTPGTAPGAQLDFMSELKSVVEGMIHQGTIDISDPTFKLDIKLSGDGAKMSRLTNFVVISFSVLNNKKMLCHQKVTTHLLSLKATSHTICSKVLALLYLSKSTNWLKARELKSLAAVFQWKFILEEITRCDVSKHQNFYWENLTRTTKDIIECSMKNIFSCAFKPLVNIPLCNVVLDELHLMLRVTGKELFK
ncbi:Hypothetical predicted protein [Paramuricea clavata]|uniref:Uncharacterized protein n=1 Tax=Paramuricea clavata TaxID=317549 RepID=A0A7D9DSN0_PARCT|nr:Hypothetical predicted protein [Paramuricea clavata]